MPCLPPSITFRYAFCGDEKAEDRKPGPTPKECRACEVDAYRSLVRQWVEAYGRRQDEKHAIVARGSVADQRRVDAGRPLERGGWHQERSR
jgi:hypothetical protein